MLPSALIHAADADVGGVAGLISPGKLRSVLVCGIGVGGLSLGCLVMRLRGGAVGLLLASIVIPAPLVYVLAMGGSTATTALGIAWSFLGLLLIGVATLAVAVLPAAALGWPRAGEQRQRRWGLAAGWLLEALALARSFVRNLRSVGAGKTGGGVNEAAWPAANPSAVGERPRVGAGDRATAGRPQEPH